MEVSGNGVTFNDRDIQMGQRIIGMMLKSEFKVGAKEIMLASEALVWFEQDLMPNMEKCVLEIKKVTRPISAVPDHESSTQQTE